MGGNMKYKVTILLDEQDYTEYLEIVNQFTTARGKKSKLVSFSTFLFLEGLKLYKKNKDSFLKKFEKFSE